MQKLVGLMIIVMVVYGCNNSTTSLDKTSMVTIEILQNGLLRKTFVVTESEDGKIYPINFEEQQIGELEIYLTEFISDPPEEERIIAYHSIARKYGNYSIFNTIAHFDTLRIDYQRDFDVVNENLNCGVMYDRSVMNDPANGLIVNARFSVWKDSVFVDSLFTDSLGRFETEIESGSYLIKSGEPEISFETEFDLIEGYADYSFNYYLIDYKPNIYIYPENQISLDVNISFPKSGEVIKSIPKFPEQWQNLQIESDGKINNKYDYLFYESIQPNIFQKRKGWIIKLENLKSFFEENLRETGFKQDEIDDFIEYWIPKLTDSKYYAIYPQYNEQLDPLIRLDFSQQPDSILRLTYYISKLKSNEIELSEPDIPSFERKGFVVTEWGVVLGEK